MIKLVLLLCLLAFAQEKPNAVVVRFEIVRNFWRTDYYTYVKLIGYNQKLLVMGDPRYIEGDSVIVYDKNIGKSNWTKYFEQYRWGLR
jgi:hypothetical protein